MFDRRVIEYFIGHTKELETFLHWVSHNDTPHILFFHDFTDIPEKKGGVGKTWLLRKCAELEKKYHPQTAIAIVDFFGVEDRDGVEVARRIVKSVQEVYPNWT